MENSTNATESPGNPPEPFLQLYWLFSVLVLCILIIFSVYLLACLGRYATITKCNPGREISGKKGRVLYRLCLVSLVMAVARFSADMAVAVVGWQDDKRCVTTVSVSAVFYSLSLYPIYIFLWMRQSIFYANPVLSHILNPVVTFISWATLVTMLSGGAVLTVIYILPSVTGWEYEATESGCRDAADVSGFDLVTALVVAFTVSFQISLLALFMYPLLTKKTQRYRKESARETVRETPQVESGSYDDNSAPERISDEISSDIKKPRAESEIKTENEAPKNATASSVSSVSYVGKAKRSNRRYFKGGSVFYRRKQKVNGTNGKNGVFRLSHVSTASFTDLMKRPRSSSSSNTTEEVKKPKRSKTQQGRRIIRFMRKAFFLTLLCVVSDVVIAIIQMVVVVPEVVYLVLFDINLLINVICIVMSFRDWPHMIAPLCAKYLLPPKSPSHNSANNARSTKTVVTKAGNNLPRINALKPQGTSSCSESNG